MIQRPRQQWLTAPLFLFLIACNPDGNIDEHEPRQKTFALAKVGEQTTRQSLHDDNQFVELIAEKGLLEVQVATLTINKSSSDILKGFAVTMLTDHTIFNSELQEITAAKNRTLPNKLGKINKAQYDELASKSSSEFDEAYCAFVVKDHQEAVLKFKEEIEKGTDPKIRDWAARKIVILEQHLAKAKALHHTGID